MNSFARHTFWAISMLAMVASIALVGCGSNDNGGAGAVPPGIAPIVPTQVCQANQIYHAQYGCLNPCSNQPGYGWVPGEARCVPGTIVNSTSGTNFFTAITITNRATFELLLGNAGYCDPIQIGWNWGSSSCENYSHAGYMILEMPTLSGNGLPAQATVTVGAGSRHPNQSNSSGWTGGTVLRPRFFTSIAYANFSQGFTGTPVGNNGLPGGFRFIVNQGLPGNSYQLNVDLQYNGQTFANGTLVRY